MRGSLFAQLVYVVSGFGFLCAAPLSRAEGSAQVTGAGPVGGTNFGWGDRNLKMSVAASSTSPTPVQVRIECYWIYKDRSRHGLALADRRVVALSGGKPLNYEIVSVAQRNNGAVDGIVQATPTGPYRGWLIVGYDAQGKIIGSSANLPEFVKLAPGADKRPAGLEGPSGLENRRPSGLGGTGLKPSGGL
jgi:hypothetical protein